MGAFFKILPCGSRRQGFVDLRLTPRPGNNDREYSRRRNQEHAIQRPATATSSAAAG